MTILNMMRLPLRLPVMSGTLLLLIGQMALIIASFRKNRNRRIRALFILHFVIGFFLTYLPMLLLEWGLRYPLEEERLPGIIRSFRDLPVWTLVCYEILSAASLSAAFLELRRFSRDNLTPECVKETMDLLPAGIAFGRPDGTAVFSNVAMNRLSRILTGKGITNLFTFRDVLAGNPVDDDENSLQAELPGGAGVWQITSEYLNAEDEPYIQMTATDITEQAAIAAELSDKNRKLRDLHMRLEIYNRQANRIVIAQELLTARMTVHSEVGSVLLESRHYLKDPNSIDEDMLLQALRNTNTYLLREYEEDDTDRDPLADALETAEAIGVEVILAGVPPVAEPLRGILAAAVGECSTNTVKHADGNQLRVDVRTDGAKSSVTFTLQSNGTPPSETIRESGGLLSLRTLVEKHRGTMQVISDPVFRLVLTLPTDLQE